MTLYENLKYLHAVSLLKQNWFGKDEGTPIPKVVIEKTKKILKSLGKYQPYIYPTVDGCIQMEWDGIKKGDYLEIVVREDRIEYMQMLNGETIDIDTARIDGIPKCVKAFYKEVTK